MGKLRVVNVGVVNVVTQPHSPEIYVDLFKKLKLSHIEAKVRGDSYATVGMIYSEEDHLRGTLHRYVKIDPNVPLMDLVSHEPLVDENGKPKPLPEQLKRIATNCREVGFVFFPKNHRLAIDTKHMSPRLAKETFQRLIEEVAPSMNIDQVNLTVEPSIDEVNEIRQAKNLSQLFIRVKQANQDEVDDLISSIDERYKTLNVFRYDHGITSVDEEGIKKDPELDAMILLGASNGYVSAKSKVRGRIVRMFSTEKHPIIGKQEYNPDESTLWEAIENIGRKLVENIARNFIQKQ